MSLPLSIATDAARLLADVDELSAWLTRLKDFLPVGTSEEARRLYTNARGKVIHMRADINGIMSSGGAGQLIGQAENGTPEPEHLQPVSREVEEVRVASARRYDQSRATREIRQVPHEALLASLHRVGDHTLDEEEGAPGGHTLPHEGVPGGHTLPEGRRQG